MLLHTVRWFIVVVSVGVSSQFFGGWFECPCQLSSERGTGPDDKTMRWCWRLACGRAIVCIYPNSLTSTKLCKAAGDWQGHQQKLCKAAGDWQSHQQALQCSWRLAEPSTKALQSSWRLAEPSTSYAKQLAIGRAIVYIDTKTLSNNNQPKPSQPLTRPSSGVSRAPRARPRHVRQAAPRRPGRCTRQSHRACSCHTHTHTHTHTHAHTHTHTGTARLTHAVTTSHGHVVRGSQGE
jgi:hypothetical protein